MTGRSRGFTLIESLVALVVLSVGMLGAAAMLVGSMRTHADALRRLAAVNLLRDMADRIRANPGGRDAYDTHAPDAGCAGDEGCGPAARASTDRAHFAAAAARISPWPSTVIYEPATGPATPERFVIALDVGRTPSESDVLTMVLAQTPVAGGA